MATVIGVQLLPTGSTRSQTGWNNIENPSATGLRVADLIEVSAGASTGYSLTQNGAFAGAVENPSLATSSPDVRFDVQVFQAAWYVGLADDDAATFTIGNLPVGATVTLEAAACSGNSSRDTTFSLIGETTVSELYDAGAIDPVPQPTFLQTIVPSSGEVIIRNIGSSVFAYNNGWILTVDDGAASAPSITTADDITSEGQTATFTLSGNTAAPTSATLNGTDVGALTDQGSGVYSYTATLIADDDTAELVVSVDSTTVSTTISYANSLPYALTDHAEPDANSVMYGNQFGTQGPVEIGEPQLISGDAQAATIDWAGMDSAQGWTADINNYATTSGDGEQVWGFTYLVAETNETGTFQRTLQIGDGGIVIERTLTRSLVRSLAGRSLRRKL